MSDIASTSSSGQSTRQYPQTFVADISCRVDVPVVCFAAMGARPSSNIERNFIDDRAAGVACLRARIPAVALDERLTGTRRLVFEEVRQHRPTHVGSRLREIVVFHYPLHIQIFDRDDLVFVYDLPAELMKVVTPGARDALMRAGDQFASLVAALGPFLFAGQRLLFPLEVARRLAQMARVVELGAVACDGKMRQPNVNTNGASLRRDGGKLGAILGQDRRVELPASVSTDGYGFELADNLAVDDALRPTDFRQIDQIAFDLHALGILDRLPPVLGFEARVFAALGEKVLIGSREVLQGLLQRLRVGILEPFELLLELGQANRHGVVVHALSGINIETLIFGKGVVPRPTRAAELDGKRLRLLVSGIEAYASSVEHGVRYTVIASKSRRKRLTASALYPRPKGRGFTAGLIISNILNALHLSHGQLSAANRLTHRDHCAKRRHRKVMGRA